MSKNLEPKGTLVSVVIAAYNSSRRLRCAVKSVLDQSHQNLEVIVVGDNCTDDSESTLHAINDSRIRWENLPTNWGEQSVPSNRGIEIATGDFIFFLNQDDLWLKDHVRCSLEEMDRLSLDFTWSEYLIIPPGYRPNARDSKPVLVGRFAPEIGIDPLIFIPASCTGWRTEALKAIDGWRTAGEVVVSPSQDLIWRANRAGLKCGRMSPPTVLVLWSGDRPGSYLPSYVPEDNEFWLDVVTSSPENISEEILVSDKKVTPKIARIIYRALGQIITWLGFHPKSLELWLRHRIKGGFINHIRARNSLSRKSFRTQTISERRK